MRIHHIGYLVKNINKALDKFVGGGMQLNLLLHMIGTETLI
jgi:catechol 2,3-dioxygenase-like lactoylglutathione lyase family enzyme